ncbi:MAG: dihydrolipoamide acetyltransferase family protein [Pseudomonadales bacterium]
MSEFVFKLPDLGEGTVEAEIVEWHVQAGDSVQEDQVIVDVMTDKANVEVPAPVTGTVVRTAGQPGDLVAVGSELIVFAVGAAQTAALGQQAAEVAQTAVNEPTPRAAAEQPETTVAINNEPTAVATTSASELAPKVHSASVITSPAIRRHAKEAGIDLSTITGTGPRGRILRRDLEAAVDASEHPDSPGASASAYGLAADPVEEIKVIGVRRMIAERMSAAKRNIPHFSYVEEIDVTALESLRQALSAAHPDQRLTYLPLIATALIRALREQPLCNALFDADAGVLRRFERVHLGIATQTPDGLKVPVIRSADTLSLWQLAAQIRQSTDAAKQGSLAPKNLSGSSITLTSLGKLGGIASTPVINAPEVSVIGVNKAVQRPMVVNGQITIRSMMNLSASFDHRIVDGYDGANLIAHMKRLLEEPALLFVAPPKTS